MSVISVENLGKKYIIGHNRYVGESARSPTFRESLERTARGMFQRVLHPLRPGPGNSAKEEFWALRDVDFAVHRGDRVGIIGRNGAGKSTLLKILSRITEPTTGRIEIDGRVASLLEVGTGFHPELNGRENIFLNGAILGMSRAEIRHRLDEIVAFADIERFLDTPVKRYSSGMYVRLAFSVAAHLEPEILVVDEVLAVGDAAFQQKCLGKMEDVTREGRTVLFVSHNMGAIRQLCDLCFLLDRGRMVRKGSTEDVIQKYVDTNTERSGNSVSGSRGVIEGRLISETPEAVIFGISYDLGQRKLTPPQFAINIYSSSQVRACSLVSDYSNNSDVLPVMTGRGVVSCRFNLTQLMPGEYQAKFMLWTPGEKIDETHRHLTFTVLPRKDVDIRFNQGHGVVVCDDSWKMES